MSTTSESQPACAMTSAEKLDGTVPLVRVPWNDPAHIQKALDAGAYGIICPMINNRAEAEKFVGSCRYAPLGYRSSGPIRAALYGGADYHMKANDIVLAFGMIESQEALDNLDEILSVIDGKPNTENVVNKEVLR